MPVKNRDRAVVTERNSGVTVRFLHVTPRTLYDDLANKNALCGE